MLFLSIIIGSGLIGSISSLIFRYFDINNKKKATLYYPLFLSCIAIIEAVNESEKIGIDNSKKQLISSSKILDQIVYNHGSLIYLEGIDLQRLLKMKSDLDKNIQSFADITPRALKDLLKSAEFIEIKNNAIYLQSISKNNVKTLREILV